MSNNGSPGWTVSPLSKKSSIVGYLTDKNADDINSLKEFYE